MAGRNTSLTGGSASGKGGKTKSGGGGRKTGGKGDTISDDSPSHTGHVTERESGHPLIHLVKEEENRLWMAGNATLAHLTLSCELPSSSFYQSFTSSL